jgi:hypothetical protein
VSELIAGTYDGFRMFFARDGRLYSIAKEYEYVPGLNVATCHANNKHEKIPAKGCGCGFWLYHTEYQARDRFDDHLKPPPSRRGVYNTFGDFGEDDDGRPCYVLGKVVGGGLAIVGSDGCRAEQVRIVALVTNDPDAVPGPLAYYNIGTVAPRTKAEEGFTTGCIVKIDDDTLTLDRVDRSTTEATGEFAVEHGIRIPDTGTYVTAQFEHRGRMRVVTSIRAHSSWAELG